MKKILATILLLTLSHVQAQDYLITFEGLGASTTVATVEVQNITQGTSVSLSGTDTLNLVGVLGIEDNSVNFSDGLNISPNPMTSESTITFDLEKASPVAIEVFDITGKIVTGINTNFQAGQQAITISNLTTGVYIVRIKTDDTISTGKLISVTASSKAASLNYTHTIKSHQEHASKSSNAIVLMEYNDGDILHFKGISGDYSTLTALSPTANAIVSFNFVEAIDSDGNQYTTITLGSQTWMLENLKTTSFADGTPITEWEFGDDWYDSSSSMPLYQWADTSDLNNLYDDELPFDFFGAMYNEFALNSGNLAPEGWRIPSEQDFMDLETYLAATGQSGTQATALKSSYGWTSNNNGTNAIGFNGLPNGYVSAVGTATGAQSIASWGTTNVNTSDQTRRIINLHNEGTIQYHDNSVLLGTGIRGIKD